MSAIHPDEATLLRSVLGDLPERRQADLRRHVARCRPCRRERELTKRLHEGLSAAGDSLAFATGDAFAGRPVFQPVGDAGDPAVKAMAAVLRRLEGEKQRILAAIAIQPEVTEAARALDLDGAVCRLAAAHVLEEAVAADPSRHLAGFAAKIAERDAMGGEAEVVLPGAQLRALAQLVLGNWLLFAGRPDEAAAEFNAAWAALGAFDAPEHLCAWAEVGESLRRSYVGRAVEGRLLAERALETFERYGLGRGVLRARHARAVALYTASEFREAHREFRAAIRSKDATGLDRARSVSGAAFCLAARGRFHDAAKEYSRVRRRLRGEGAQAEQYLLQAEMKAATGTAGRWHALRDGLAAFPLPEAGGAFHARETAAGIVKGAADEGASGLDKAKELLGKIEADPSRGYAYLYACQLAMPKVASDPAMYVEFARAVSETTRCLPYLKDKGPAQPVCREQVLGEAALLESNALNFLGKPAEARVAAQRARVSFVEAGEDSFALALADYFEGSAVTFVGDFPSAWKLLKGARSEFQSYGQENWQGRAEAALGVLLQSHGRCHSALHFLDGALRLLHPEQDGSSYAATLVNRGFSLARTGRLDSAKSAYARALVHARRLDGTLHLFTIRTGLATIELIKGNVVRALCSFERIVADATREGLEEHVLGAQLRVAECLSRLGRSDDVPMRIEEIRRSPYAVSLLNEVVFRELFESVEVPSAAQIAHIADYFEGKSRGVRTPYKPFRLVANGY
jgi:tetratricopeptide (TPR) repeat protein